MNKLIQKYRENKQKKINSQLFFEKKEEIQGYQYYLLESLVKLCEEYEIEYWLEGGSLIGAYFHEGIIPWDDDLDLALTRKGFEKLQKHADKLPKDIVLQYAETEPKFNSVMFYKLRHTDTIFDDGTYFTTKACKYQGVFIDLFIYDDTEYESFDKVPNNIKNMANIQQYRRYFYELLHIIPFEKYFSKKLQTTQIICDENKYIHMAYEQFNSSSKKHFFKKETIFPLKKVKFGNLIVNAPNDTEGYLIKLYPTLTKYPPKDEQVPSHLHDYKKLK